MVWVVVWFGWWCGLGGGVVWVVVWFGWWCGLGGGVLDW